MTALLEPDALARAGLRDAIGAVVEPVGSFDELAGLMRSNPGLATVVLGPNVDHVQALDFAERLRGTNPTVGVLLVRRRVDAAILTQAIRSGVREVIMERDSRALSDAVQRSLDLTNALRTPNQRDSYARTESSGPLITVFSPKGGAGKTTLAVNVGVGLASKGYRTLVLDLDLAFGDVPISLGLRPEYTFRDVTAVGEQLDASALERLVTVHDSGLHVLAPSGEPGDTEQVPLPVIRRLLQVCTSQYQYVIADTPPTLDDRLMAIMEDSDIVFLLTTLDIPSLKNVKISLETLRLVDFPTARLRLVMNRADSKVGLDAREVERALGVEVVAHIPSSRDVPTTANRGVAIIADQPRHAVSVAITNLIHQEITKEEPVDRKRAGLFGRRWTR